MFNVRMDGEPVPRNQCGSDGDNRFDRVRKDLTRATGARSRTPGLRS